jgi:hypothetical protein
MPQPQVTVSLDFSYHSYSNIYHTSLHYYESKHLLDSPSDYLAQMYATEAVLKSMK